MSEANELEQIRARHINKHDDPEFSEDDGYDAHNDRATLLRLLDAAREDLREAGKPILLDADERTSVSIFTPHKDQKP